ncbi:MAG: hypothetical protein KJS64_00285 [Acidobacteria bacterium]|nr:hypothetical protein [Acidobacteriota bacterium]
MKKPADVTNVVVGVLAIAGAVRLAEDLFGHRPTSGQRLRALREQTNTVWWENKR